ncbi:MAG TPA: M20 family metallopeptidase [Candidatus Brocadiia bacterium]|nr:M20 family metallopeptidase [Candidatus Brocadiia bacterium]
MSEVVELLAQMVAIPSVNPEAVVEPGPDCGEARMARFVRDWLCEHGVPAETFDVFPDRPNVIATVDGPGDAAPIVFCAHMDTVRIDGMTISPFDPVIRVGRLWGRGSCDDKGSLAGFMTALADCVRSGGTGRKVTLVATMGEEISLVGISKALEWGIDAKMAVVGEPTGLRLINAHKGAIRWRMATLGRCAHSSTPELGENAIYKIVPVLNAVRSIEKRLAARPPHPQLGRPTISVGIIKGGNQVNIVPDRCRIDVDRRAMPSETEESIFAELDAALEENGVAPGSVEIERFLNSPGLETQRDAEIVTQVARACSAVGLEPTPQGVAFCTEAGPLSCAGIPAVVIGPGEPSGAHTADESIEIAQLEASVRLYSRLMRGA